MSNQNFPYEFNSRYVDQRCLNQASNRECIDISKHFCLIRFTCRTFYLWLPIFQNSDC